MESLINACGKYDYLQKLCDFLSFIAAAKEENVVIGLLLVLGGIYTCLRFFIFIIHAFKHKRYKSNERKKLCESFSDKDFEEASKHYIQPNGSNIDPSNSDDLRAVVGVKQPIMEAIEDEIKNHDGKKHILVLADSGMGKTTFLLNFTQEKMNEGKRVSLVSLNRSNSIAQIKKVEDQRETILLLDAFDEDTKAIEDLSTRINEIIEAAQNFDTVIMTCRTQFFVQDSQIPRETGLLKVGPKRAGNSGTHEWRTIYLLPFNQEQVSKFINSVIPIYMWGIRKKAKELVKKIPELAARPMLLNLIPEIASRKVQIDNIWDLYEFMVAQWAEREKAWIGKTELINLSKAVAFEIYSKRNTRGSERIPIGELLTIFNDDFKSNNIESWQFQTRSLLNRDADGNFKFAHRSIMEYFYVLAFIEGNDAGAEYKWTDMMCELFINCGHANKIPRSRESEIFNLDLRETLIFPFLPKHPKSSNVNEAWAKSVFQLKLNNITNLPPSWRKYISKTLNMGPIYRAYDFASGNVFQYIDTTEFDSSDLKSYAVNRGVNHWKDDENRDWNTPQLTEIKTLIEILALNQQLKSLDSRVLYWLADTDSTKKSTFFHMSLVGGPRISEYSGLTKLHSADLTIDNTYISIDIFVGNLFLKPLNFVQAVPIHIHHGDSMAMWHNDKKSNQNRSWALESQSSYIR